MIVGTTTAGTNAFEPVRVYIVTDSTTATGSTTTYGLTRPTSQPAPGVIVLHGNDPPQQRAHRSDSNRLVDLLERMYEREMAAALRKLRDWRPPWPWYQERRHSVQQLCWRPRPVLRRHVVRRSRCSAQASRWRCRRP